MKKARILLGFSKLSDANLEIKVNAILTAMTGNEYFPNPEPSLEAFGIAIENFSAAVSASRTRHKVSVVARKNMRDALEQVMRHLADYVNFTAKGDRLMLVSSGFDVSAESYKLRLLAEPQNLTVFSGKNSGEALVSVTRVPYSVTYLCFYAPAPVVNNLWMHASGKSPSLLITGLDPVKLYCFRMGVVGRNGQLVYTDITTRMVI